MLGRGSCMVTQDRQTIGNDCSALDNQIVAVCRRIRPKTVRRPYSPLEILPYTVPFINLVSGLNTVGSTVI